MNKKGFTLIEILSTIVLIALLLGLGIPGVMKISDNMKKRSYNTKVNLIEQAGILWGQDNKTRLQSNPDCQIEKNSNNSKGEYNCKKIKINDLIAEDYLEADAIKEEVDLITGVKTYKYEYFDPSEDNKNISEKCVYVYKKNNRVYAYYGDETTCD